MTEYIDLLTGEIREFSSEEEIELKSADWGKPWLRLDTWNSLSRTDREIALDALFTNEGG